VFVSAHEDCTYVVLLQLVGSLKLWVSCAKELYKRDDILNTTYALLLCTFVSVYTRIYPRMHQPIRTFIRSSVFISCCRRATNYRALLREMTYKDTASYASAPLCIQTFIRSSVFISCGMYIVLLCPLFGMGWLQLVGSLKL